MGLFKQILTGLATGNHGNKHGFGKQYGHHGQQRYNRDSDYYPNMNNSSSNNAVQKCLSCQQSNPIVAKFCGQCGKSLAAGNCKGCDQALTPNSKFCGNCGQGV